MLSLCFSPVLLQSLVHRFGDHLDFVEAQLALDEDDGERKAAVILGDRNDGASLRGVHLEDLFVGKEGPSVQACLEVLAHLQVRRVIGHVDIVRPVGGDATDEGLVPRVVARDLHLLDGRGGIDSAESTPDGTLESGHRNGIVTHRVEAHPAPTWL